MLKLSKYRATELSGLAPLDRIDDISNCNSVLPYIVTLVSYRSPAIAMNTMHMDVFRMMCGIKTHPGIVR